MTQQSLWAEPLRADEDFIYAADNSLVTCVSGVGAMATDEEMAAEIVRRCNREPVLAETLREVEKHLAEYCAIIGNAWPGAAAGRSQIMLDRVRAALATSAPQSGSAEL